MKKLIALLLLLCMIPFALVACEAPAAEEPQAPEQPQQPEQPQEPEEPQEPQEPQEPAPTPLTVVVNALYSEVAVGSEITFSVTVSNAPTVKTCGFRLQYDTEKFELVSGRMLVSGVLSDFSNGMGVAAFEGLTDINKPVMEFVLRAKQTTDASSIGCEASLKGENDVTIPVVNAVPVTVKVTG